LVITPNIGVSARSLDVNPSALSRTTYAEFGPGIEDSKALLA
jgi:hypothetical protein